MTQVVDAFERLPGKEQRDEPVSAELNTYEVIARARYGCYNILHQL